MLKERVEKVPIMYVTPPAKNMLWMSQCVVKPDMALVVQEWRIREVGVWIVRTLRWEKEISLKQMRSNRQWDREVKEGLSQVLWGWKERGGVRRRHALNSL